MLFSVSQSACVSKSKSKLNIASSRQLVSDIPNVDIILTKSKPNISSNLSDHDDLNDITLVENEDGYAPDSFSPHERSGYPRILSQKV